MNLFWSCIWGRHPILPWFTLEALRLEHSDQEKKAGGTVGGMKTMVSNAEDFKSPNLRGSNWRM